MEEIRPRVNSFFLFLMNIHFGIKPLERRVEDYDRVILCGPIWVGRFIPPLRSFVLKYRDRIQELVFVTSCGSSFAQKDEKFGHALVFKKVEEIMGEKCVLCQAFPVGLVLEEGHENDPDAFQKAHLNEGNFNGRIKALFDAFIEKLRSRSGEMGLV